MAIIPPPIQEPRDGRSPCAIFALIFAVCALLMVAGGAALLVFGYTSLEAPGAMANEIRERAAETHEAQQATMDTSRAEAGEAIPEDFTYPRAVRRWHSRVDGGMRAFLRDLVHFPEGFHDQQWIAYANRAEQSGDWPESLDPGRHAPNTLLIHAAAWLDGEDAWHALRAAVAHGLAWRVRNPLEEEYSRNEDYLGQVRFLAQCLAVAGAGAARAGEREAAWEHLELLNALDQQLLREPDPHATREAIEMRFYADVVLWALIDDGPLLPAERPRYEAILDARSDTAPLRHNFEIEAALAPARGGATGFFPRLARRVMYDRLWDNQQAILDALDTPPHEVADDFRERYRAVPLYAEETDDRLRHNFYLHRIHWQSRFHWELLEIAAALKQWKAENGEYPIALDELVDAGALDEVPHDPIWDDPVHYARLGEGFALYIMRVEDWYWLYEHWLDGHDPNDWEEYYGLDWEVIWRAME